MNNNMDLSGDFAQGWRPNEGDTLIGVVTDLSRNWSDYTNSYYPIVTIRSEDGSETAIHCFHYSLRQQVLSMRPQVGETVGVKYKGKTKTKDGKRTVAVYVMKVKGRTEDIYAGMEPDHPVPTASRQSDIPVDDNDFTPAAVPGKPDDDDIPF